MPREAKIPTVPPPRRRGLCSRTDLTCAHQNLDVALFVLATLSSIHGASLQTSQVINLFEPKSPPVTTMPGRASDGSSDASSGAIERLVSGFVHIRTYAHLLLLSRRFLRPHLRLCLRLFVLLRPHLRLLLRLYLFM